MTQHIRQTAIIWSFSFRVRPRPQHAGEIGKRGFISAVRPTIRTKPFQKRSSNRRNSKTPGLRFSADGNKSFSKTMALRQSCDFPVQIQNDQRLLRYLISPAQRGRRLRRVSTRLKRLASYPLPEQREKNRLSAVYTCSAFLRQKYIISVTAGLS